MHYSDNLNSLLQESLTSFTQIPEAVWAHRTTQSKWSKKEILGHLCDSAIFNLARFESAKTKKQIDVFAYPQATLVKANDYIHRPTNLLIDQWKKLNEHIGFIWQSFETRDLSKVVVLHTTKETNNLKFLIEDYLIHMKHHLDQITNISNDTTWLFDLTSTKSSLKNQDNLFLEVFRKKKVSIELYKPEKVDHQSPHDQDEIYVVAEGKGFFLCGEESTFVTQGDVMWVPKHKEHRFFDFSDDFSVWVIFY